MGKGSNVSKSAVARARKEKRMAQQGKGGGGKDGKAKRLGAGSAGNTCQMCRCTFGVTQNRSQLELHVSNKHSKNSFSECFPDFVDSGKGKKDKKAKKAKK